MKRIKNNFLNGSMYYELNANDCAMVVYDSDMKWIGNVYSEDLVEETIKELEKISDTHTFLGGILCFCDHLIYSNNKNELIELANNQEDDYLYIENKEYYTMEELEKHGINRIGNMYFITDLE